MAQPQKAEELATGFLQARATPRTSSTTPPTGSPPPRPSGTDSPPSSASPLRRDEYACPTCKDKGWLVYDVAPGHPLFSARVRCTACGPAAEQAHLRSICGLPEEMLAWTFENTLRHAGNSAAFDIARLLAERPGHIITLLGGFGIGKTQLLACIVNAARVAGLTAVYTTTANALDSLRRTFDADDATGSYDARWEFLTTADVLCLDEFDRWNRSPWAEEKFFQLVDARYTHQARRLTAFAGNACVEELPPYVASRIRDARNYLFELTGQDVRRLQRS